MKLPDIEVRVLSVGECVTLKMGDIYDFLVLLFTDGCCWRGACRRDDLQVCIGVGMTSFKKRKDEV